MFVGCFAQRDIASNLLRGRLQAKCGIDRIPQRRVVRAIATACITHHCVARIDPRPDPEGKRQGIAIVKILRHFVERIERLKNPHHLRITDTLGSVEPDCHHRIANILINPTATLADDIPRAAEPSANQLGQNLFIELSRQHREVPNIDHQDRNETAHMQRRRSRQLIRIHVYRRRFAVINRRAVKI